MQRYVKSSSNIRLKDFNSLGKRGLLEVLQQAGFVNVYDNIYCTVMGDNILCYDSKDESFDLYYTEELPIHISLEEFVQAMIEGQVLDVEIEHIYIHDILDVIFEI